MAITNIKVPLHTLETKNIVSLPDGQIDRIIVDNNVKSLSRFSITIPSDYFHHLSVKEQVSEWLDSEPGKYLLEHALNKVTVHCAYNYAIFSEDSTITGIMFESDYTFYMLKWGS